MEDNPTMTPEISTHALTWSATLKAFALIERLLEFQLTHSRGVRRSISG